MNKLNSGTRLITMLLDHFIMAVVVMVVVAPGAIYDIVHTFGNPDAQPRLFLGNFYLDVLGFSLYFNKDIFQGRSPAKRALKFQIVDIKTGQPAGPLKCLLRNLTILLWPLEVIVSLINNERRIGDFIAGTKLTTYNPEQHTGKINWITTILAIILSALYTYLVMFLPMLAFRGTELLTH